MSDASIAGRGPSTPVPAARPPVRFGLTFGFRNPAYFGLPFADFYRDSLHIAELADQLGYDSIWVTEHHLIEDGYCPAPLEAVAALAARTERVTVGTKILIAALHDPLELAEVGAFLDQLSGGRFQLGMGAGYRREEFEAKGIPFAERGARLEETIEILRQAWSRGIVDFQGDHYRFDGVSIHPPPVQRPHPRIWLGAGSGRALERVLRHGFPLMLGSARDGYDRYLEGIRRGGGDPDQAEIIHSLSAVHVAEDGARARAEAWPGVAWLQWRPVGETPPMDELTRPEAVPTVARVGPASAVGDPDEVADALLEMDAETPLRHVTFHAQIPGVPLDAIGRSVRLFIDEVVPRVLERSVRGRAGTGTQEKSS